MWPRARREGSGAPVGTGRVAFTRRALALAGALAAAAAARPAAATAAGGSKVAYHLDDHDKVGPVLANIHNHYAGCPDGVRIALVVHGPALEAFRKDRAAIEVSDALSALLEAGLEPVACGNTMKGRGIALTDLLPGFSVAASGGVVRLADLQGAGYAYLRP